MQSNAIKMKNNNGYKWKYYIAKQFTINRGKEKMTACLIFVCKNNSISNILQTVMATYL